MVTNWVLRCFFCDYVDLQSSYRVTLFSLSLSFPIFPLGSWLPGGNFLCCCLHHPGCFDCTQTPLTAFPQACWVEGDFLLHCADCQDRFALPSHSSMFLSHGLPMGPQLSLQGSSSLCWWLIRLILSQPPLGLLHWSAVGAKRASLKNSFCLSLSFSFEGRRLQGVGLFSQPPILHNVLYWSEHINLFPTSEMCLTRWPWLPSSALAILAAAGEIGGGAGEAAVRTQGWTCVSRWQPRAWTQLLMLLLKPWKWSQKGIVRWAEGKP